MHVTLSDLAADIIRNACASGADTVEFDVTEMGSEFRFLVRDNGRGMTKVEAEEAVVPLDDAVRDGRGLGIPFLIQTVADSAGGWDLHTEKGGGTAFSVWFDVDTPETPPVGDIAALFCSVLLFPGPNEFVIRRLRKTGNNDVRYEIRKSELKASLGELTEASSRALLDNYLESLEENPSSAGR